MNSKLRIGLLSFFVLAMFTITIVVNAQDVTGGNPDAVSGTVEREIRGNEGVGSKTDEEVVQREEEKINPDGFSVAEMKNIRATAEKHTFQAEVNKLMNIIINSLYSNREVFLRELISNASDALDKIRFLSLTNSTQLDSGSKLEIRIKADLDAKTLTISDIGVGMTKKQLVENLGTIAKSGTAEFMDRVKNGTSTESSLIGQFGVGFYSAFLVADKVTVVSKSNEDEFQHVWRSNAQGEFSVAQDPRGDTLKRGTSIILHINDDADEFLEEQVLRNLVRKYSMFINFPIYLWTSKEVEEEVPLTEEEIQQEIEKRQKQKEEENSEEVSLDSAEDQEKKEQEKEEQEQDIPKTKKSKKTVSNWEIMNETKPLWTRNPKDVTEDEYNEFYKSITRDEEDPMMKIHFLAEGEVEFKSLLYIPKKMTSNYDPNNQSEKGIKLYVKRVFITDTFKDIMPRYLSFLRGVVDSDDLPLNVSREMLQESKILQMIKKKLIRKAIAMFQDLADEEDKTKYMNFWEKFGSNLKLGMIEDQANRNRLSKLLLFESSKTKKLTSLQEYVDRMKEGQTQIYYIAGSSRKELENSPLLERLLKDGYEVLFLLEAVDEYAVNNLEKFDGRFKLTNVARENLKFDGAKNEEDKERRQKERLQNLLKFLKNELKESVEKVTTTNRLSSSPAALVSGSSGFTANMERIIRSQAGVDTNAAWYQAPKKILEVNPTHPLIRELNRRIQDNSEDPVNKELAHMIYDTAALSSGFSVEDSAAFATRVVKMMNKNLNVDENAAVVEEEEIEEESPAVDEQVNTESEETNTEKN